MLGFSHLASGFPPMHVHLGAWLPRPGPLATLAALAAPSPTQTLGTGSQGPVYNLFLDQTFVTHAAVTLVILALAIIGGRWLSHLAGRAPVRLERRLARAGKALDGERSLGRWLNRLTLICIWVAAAVAIMLTWFSEQTVKELRITPEAMLGFAQHVGASLLVIACTLAIARVLQRTLEDSLERRLNPNLTLLVGRAVFVATLAVGLVIVLAMWGTGVALPVTLIGALTVALSFALQDVLKNLVAGVYLLLEHPFSIGERISLAPYTGTVEDIEIRYTALRTADGQRVIIPNSMLFSSAVVNLSAAENSRSGFTVTVKDTGPDTIDRAEEHILAALESAPAVLKQPQPRISVTRAAGGTVDLQVLYWLPSAEADRGGEVFSHVLEQVREDLTDAEVTALDAAKA